MCDQDEEQLLKAELEAVEKDLIAVQSQIETLLNKQTELRDKKNSLKTQLKSNALRRRASHDFKSETFGWSQQMRDVGRTTFKIQTFRPLQLETMNTTLSNYDCILIMPTGAGKSLCYQLPALLDSGVTLVISPLVSLMEDQVMALEKLGVDACMLNADSSKEKQTMVYNDICKHPSKLKLLYVTPEKLAKSKRFMNKLESCYKNNLLSRIAIDEVHCCSQWGHDFRPDYKFLGILKRQFPKTPILGLTATASRHVLNDVQKILNIPHCEVYRGSFNRPNLRYRVQLKPLSHDQCMADMSSLIKSQYASQSGIIYCFSRKDTMQVADDLTKHGVKSACYHADLTTETRSRVHAAWTSGRIQIIVATIAFGMGIDKPNVRFVIHHSMSKSIENYYQESGRAGRDGEPADCILYYRQADVYRQSCMVFTESTGLEKLYSMLEYCLDTSTCRRKQLAKHFSETWGDNSCNKMCDNCDGKNLCAEMVISGVDVSSDIQRVYEVIDKASASDTRLTGPKVLEILQGKGAVKQRPTTASQLTREQCESLLGWMLIEGCIREDFHFTPYSTISYLVAGNRAHTISIQLMSNDSGSCPSGSSKRKAEKGKDKGSKAKKPKQELSKLDVIVLDDD